MNDKTYKKKVLQDSELSSPQHRAERLRTLRNISNLSRKELCSLSDININTYKGWELARFGGLPLDGADKVIDTVSNKGVLATTAWLLHGISPAPTLVNENEPSVTTNHNDIIMREFSVFNQANNGNAILFKIKNDANYPYLVEGDYVAGVRHHGVDILNCLNKLCIIQSSNAIEDICIVKESHTNGMYTLISTNHSSKHQLILPEVKLTYVAPIIRHYFNRLDAYL